MSPLVETLAAEVGDDGAEGQGTFTVTMLMDFDIDPTVDVVVPDGDYPDGTDQYLALLGQS